jgi:hypothetical protein
MGSISWTEYAYNIRRLLVSRHHFLLLLVEHRASMKSFQALRSPAIPLTSFHDLPVFLISSSIVLRHVLFGLPLLLYPWGFQSNAVFSIAPASLRNVCPIQFHFLLFIWISIGFCLVILRSSSLLISGLTKRILYIRIKAMNHVLADFALRIVVYVMLNSTACWMCKKRSDHSLS